MRYKDFDIENDFGNYIVTVDDEEHIFETLEGAKIYIDAMDKNWMCRCSITLTTERQIVGTETGCTNEQEAIAYFLQHLEGSDFDLCGWRDNGFHNIEIEEV